MAKRPSSPNPLSLETASSAPSGEAVFPLQAFVESLETLKAQLSDLGEDRRAILGVSGGRDSVVLLDLLVRQLGWKHLVVAHVNHQLRGEASEEDARFVKALAQNSGVAFEEASVDITALAAEHKVSLETAGRQARDHFFERLTRQYDTRLVFLAHHADDQAETLLSNLCRGASSKGLRGMKAIQTTRAGWLKLRPMLGLRRAWIDAYLQHHGLAYREDASNAVAEVRRNRLRLEALPLLRDIFQRDVSESMLRLAQHLAGDEAYFEQTLENWWARRDFFDPQLPEQLRLLPEFLQLPVALRDRLLHRWLTDLGVRDLSQALIARVNGMLLPGGPAKINLPGDLHLRRKQKRLWLERGTPSLPKT